MAGTEKHLLIPNEQIWLLANDCDGQAFAQQFGDCWQTIPIGARGSICAYWREQGAQWPLIELSDMWGGCKDNFAQVKLSGRNLRFAASSFKVLPAGPAKWIIAHELAHVYQKASGKKPGGESEEENERDADRIAVEWGFDYAPYFLLKRLTEKVGFEQACARFTEMGI